MHFFCPFEYKRQYGVLFQSAVITNKDTPLAMTLEAAVVNHLSGFMQVYPVESWGVLNLCDLPRGWDGAGYFNSHDVDLTRQISLSKTTNHW
ncbi:hypothetical protein JXA85_05850 [Candidatus Woesearchaeota archaeon]|nr:hypothetical protein [Candidatus Woesearchaeota archaeon]